MTTKPISKVFFTKELPASQEIDVSKLKPLRKIQVKKLFSKVIKTKKK